MVWWIIGLVVSFFLLIWGFDWALTTYFEQTDDYDQHHTVQASDGEELDLWRYTPDVSNNAEPVFLVHGLTANHRNLAFNDTSGLAQYLNERGYDCWTIDLRGRGKFFTSNGSWSFDDYLYKDVPAAIDYILDATGMDEVHWVGHSMGGMLLLAHAGSATHPKPIASGVTIGSPVRLSEPLLFKRLASFFINLPSHLYRMIRPFLLFVFLLQVYLIPWRLWFLILIEQQFSKKALRIISNVIVSRINYRVPLQFLRWLGTGEWKSEDGTVDYRSNLSEINLPILSVVGGNDRLCPDVETAGYYRIGSSEKEVINASKTEGYSQDYDHVSLVFARSAREELFPEIEEWLSGHSSVVQDP